LSIGFIGAGTMGQALIQGLIARGVPRPGLCASDADPSARNAARRRFNIWTSGDNSALAARSDVVILAVKPQQVADVAGQLADMIDTRHLVISIAAGVTLRWLSRRLPRGRLLRAMPNLPATVGEGFTAIAAGRGATRRDRDIARAVFGAVGHTVAVPERLLNAVTAVSGSGPAYVFFFVEAWQEAARQLGLPPKVASAAVAQTLEGSARLLAAASVPPGALIRRVASKRGTTEAALKVLARRRVAAHLVEAVLAAERRARTLSWKSGKRDGRLSTRRK
jgi:pyrroline-5-carboxylate reductase